MFCSPISEFRHFVTLLLFYSTIRYRSSFRKRFDNSSQRNNSFVRYPETAWKYGTLPYYEFDKIKSRNLPRSISPVRIQTSLLIIPYKTALFDISLRFAENAWYYYISCSLLVSIFRYGMFFYSTFHYGFLKTTEITAYSLLRHFVTDAALIRQFITLSQKRWEKGIQIFFHLRLSVTVPGMLFDISAQIGGNNWKQAIFQCSTIRYAASFLFDNSLRFPQNNWYYCIFHEQ